MEHNGNEVILGDFQMCNFYIFSKTYPWVPGCKNSEMEPGKNKWQVLALLSPLPYSSISPGS